MKQARHIATDGNGTVRELPGLDEQRALQAQQRPGHPRRARLVPNRRQLLRHAARDDRDRRLAGVSRQGQDCSLLQCEGRTVGAETPTVARAVALARTGLTCMVVPACRILTVAVPAGAMSILTTMDVPAGVRGLRGRCAGGFNLDDATAQWHHGRQVRAEDPSDWLVHHTHSLHPGSRVKTQNAHSIFPSVPG